MDNTKNEADIFKRIFGLLKSHGTVPIFVDKHGHKTASAQDATAIKFNVGGLDEDVNAVDDPATEIIVSITDEGKLAAYYDPEVLENNQVSDILSDLKELGVRHRIGWTPIPDKDQVHYDLQKRRDMEKNKLDEGYYPINRNTSWSDSVPTVRIIIQHTKTIQEGEARYRNVNRIFLENSDGERIACPVRTPGLARIFARVLAEGDKPYGERWNHIVGLMEEYRKISGFVRATRNGQFMEGAGRLIEAARAHYESLRETLRGLGGHRGYQRYFDNWRPVLVEESDDAGEVVEMFHQRGLDPRIESALPILAKLGSKLGESVVDSTVGQLEEWSDSLVEEILKAQDGENLEVRETKPHEEIIAKIISGDADIEQILGDPQDEEEEEASQFLNGMCDEICNQQGLDRESDPQGCYDALVDHLHQEYPHLTGDDEEEDTERVVQDANEKEGVAEGLEDSDIQGVIVDTVERLFRKNNLSDYGALEAIRQGVKHHFSKPGATAESAIEGILNILDKRMRKSGNYVDLGRFKEALRQGVAHQLKKQGVAEGSNSSPFDQMANLKSKSNKELDELVSFWQRALEKNPNHKVANDQLHIIKMIRAERIGKKGVAEGVGKDLAKIGGITGAAIGLGILGHHQDQKAEKIEVGGQQARLIKNPGRGTIPDNAMTLVGKDGKTYKVWTSPGKGSRVLLATPVENVKEQGVAEGQTGKPIKPGRTFRFPNHWNKADVVHEFLWKKNAVVDVEYSYDTKKWTVTDSRPATEKDHIQWATINGGLPTVNEQGVAEGFAGYQAVRKTRVGNTKRRAREPGFTGEPGKYNKEGILLGKDGHPVIKTNAYREYIRQKKDVTEDPVTGALIGGALGLAAGARGAWHATKKGLERVEKEPMGSDAREAGMWAKDFVQGIVDPRTYIKKKSADVKESGKPGNSDKKSKDVDEAAKWRSLPEDAELQRIRKLAGHK